MLFLTWTAFKMGDTKMTKENKKEISETSDSQEVLKQFYSEYKPYIWLAIGITTAAVLNVCIVKGKIADKDYQLCKKNQRIEKLENLCEQKDQEHLYALSDSLKHGSSYAGSELSYYGKWKNDNY